MEHKKDNKNKLIIVVLIILLVISTGALFVERVKNQNLRENVKSTTSIGNKCISILNTYLEDKDKLKLMEEAP